MRNNEVFRLKKNVVELLIFMKSYYGRQRGLNMNMLSTINIPTHKSKTDLSGFLFMLLFTKKPLEKFNGD